MKYYAGTEDGVCMFFFDQFGGHFVIRWDERTTYDGSRCQRKKITTISVIGPNITWLIILLQCSSNWSGMSPGSGCLLTPVETANPICSEEQPQFFKFFCFLFLL